LRCNMFPSDTGAMNIDLIVERPRPDTDVAVCAFEGEFVRVVGLDPTDYLSAAEARELAGVLTAAADELAPPG
jgi:hypothetical protein